MGAEILFGKGKARVGPLIATYSHKYIHTFEPFTLWRQMLQLLVEALESGADPVGA